MTKDRRYGNAKNHIVSKYVKTLDEIFANDVHKKTVVAKDLKISLDRFDEKIYDLGKWRMKELIKLADLLEVDLIEVLTLVANQHREDRKKKPSKK